MTDQAPCPRCRQENPPRNHFCGSCGAPLTSDEQLATREEHRPVPAGRAWPTKFGPVGKVLAVSVAALAAEASLSWLRTKIGAEDRSSLPALRGAGSVPRGYLVSQRSLEEVFVQMWEDHHGRVLARREIRSGMTSSATRILKGSCPHPN